MSFAGKLPTTSTCGGIPDPDGVPEVIQQWGGEWDQQQEYVFVNDAL